MDDTISRQDAIDAIYEHEFSNWCDKDEVSTILYDLPSAQKTGRWISLDTIFGGFPWKCSECECECKEHFMGQPIWNYCPFCGARMEREEE